MSSSRRELQLEPDISGAYNAQKVDYCACGYAAVWVVRHDRESGTVSVEEQAGSHCCGGVPNCFLKKHIMTREDDSTSTTSKNQRGRNVVENEIIYTGMFFLQPKV